MCPRRINCITGCDTAPKSHCGWYLWQGLLKLLALNNPLLNIALNFDLCFEGCMALPINKSRSPCIAFETLDSAEIGNTASINGSICPHTSDDDLSEKRACAISNITRGFPCPLGGNLEYNRIYLTSGKTKTVLLLNCLQIPSYKWRTNNIHMIPFDWHYGFQNSLSIVYFSKLLLIPKINKLYFLLFHICLHCLCNFFLIQHSCFNIGK